MGLGQKIAEMIAAERSGEDYRHEPDHGPAALHEQLGNCGCCGEDARWYRVPVAGSAGGAATGAPPPAKKADRRPSVGVMTADDIEGNLCEVCFYAIVTEEERSAWRMCQPREAPDGSGMGPAHPDVGEDDQAPEWDENGKPTVNARRAPRSRV